MPDPLEIDGREVGPGRATFVVAEIGVNHDGCLARARELVAAAASAGADAIKLQLFRADRLLHASAGLAAYQQASGESSATDMLRRFELTVEDVEAVVAEARRVGLVPLATPFSPEDVEVVARLKLPAVKLASPDLVNPLLTDAASDLGLPMLLSTGAATQAEIADAVARLRAREARFALLHCVSSYPTPVAVAAIGRVATLQRQFDVVVGYSDHCPHPLAGPLAVAAGASVIEKHLTYDRGATGPDHAASFDPGQLADYVRSIRDAEQLLGRSDEDRETHPAEADVRIGSRQSLVLRRDLVRGAMLTRDDLTCQRPGTGIAAARLDDICGRRLARPLAAGTMLAENDLILP
jgi:N-acetylneuraminate synthase/N,N'-diacetyllegionaminate synthase